MSPSTEDGPIAHAERAKKLIDSISTDYITAEQKREQLKVMCFLAGGADWDSEAAESDSDQDRPSQAKLHEAGATHMVFQMLTKNDQRINKELLQLGIELLESGNRTIQTWLLNHLTSGTHSIEFFLALRQLLRHAISEVEERFDHAKKCQEVKRAIKEANGTATDEEIEASLPVFEFPACGFEILRLIQLTVEGHFTELQHLLHFQPSSTTTVDIVHEVLAVLEAFMRVGPHTCNAELAVQCMDTLTELCQGPCLSNQRVLLASTVPSLCNKIICFLEFKDYQQDDDSDPSAAAITQTDIALRNRHRDVQLQLQQRATGLLLSLLEGCRSKKDAGRVISEMDLDGLERVILNGYKEYTKTTKESFGEATDVTTREGNLFFMVSMAYILMRTLAEFDQSIAQRFNPDNEVWRILSQNTGKVEIVCNTSLIRIFFPIPRICNDLTEKTKTDMLWSIDRTSPDMKVTDFTEQFELLEAEMNHQQNLKHHIWFRVLHRLYVPQQTLMFLLAVVINILLLTSYELSSEGNTFVSRYDACQEKPNASIAWGYPSCAAWLEDTGENLDQYNLSIHQTPSETVGILGLIMILSSFSNFFLYVIQYSKLFVRKCMKDFKKNHSKFVQRDKWYVKAVLKVIGVWFVVQDQLFVFNGLKVVFALLGMKHSLFFSFHLLSIAEISPDLKNVMKAVTQNGKSLVVTAIFGSIIIYMYAIIGFVFFRGHYLTDDNDLLCTDLFQCTITTLNGGLRKGDVGELLQDAEWGSVTLIIWQFSFFVIVITVLLNIIFGIIIDTFGELRENKNQIENDMNNRCFICSIDRYTLDRNQSTTKGFDYHCAEDHNLWHYLNFYVHLKYKRKSDLTGPEQHVRDCLRASPINTSFYPLNKAISLEDANLENDAVTSMLEEHKEMLESIQQRQHTQDLLLQSLLNKVSLPSATDTGTGEDTTTPE
eukprot:c6880_g1_i1.p1 GENE.c6880_g1_i1~~c6880_g1_i1.p1  ORF type:complete len:942 (-),score=263.87 c6880_g1_i1:54-2879(-)